MISDIRQEALAIIESLNNEECALLLRYFNNGMECMNAFLQSGKQGYEAAMVFVEEWEAQHERE